MRAAFNMKMRAIEPTLMMNVEHANPYLSVNGLSKTFAGLKALTDVSFTAKRGDFICLLGPSGCGKTTLLRCIGGLETPTSGIILQDGVEITKLPPKRRDFGIVFQSYALFPNLTAAENVAFGLRSLRLPARDAAQRVRELFELIGLTGSEGKFPAQMSGGQQQRVALARALAMSPGLLLLDEPLSALDAQVRIRLRREIRRLQRLFNVTTIMVTHDQEEALAMADRIVVLNQGHVEQIASGPELYQKPASSFVAGFIGAMNFLKMSMIGDGHFKVCGETFPVSLLGAPGADGMRDNICFRPADASLATRNSGPEIRVSGAVQSVEFLGDHFRVIALSQDETRQSIQIDLPSEAFGAADIEEGKILPIFVPVRKLAQFGATG